jgi:hypothetical protein
MPHEKRTAYGRQFRPKVIKIVWSERPQVLLCPQMCFPSVEVLPEKAPDHQQGTAEKIDQQQDDRHKEAG